MPDSSGQKHDSTVSDLEDYLRRSKTMKQPFERRWVLQLSYFLGNQWTAIDRTGRLYEPELDPWQLKLVDNRIMPAVLTQVAKMTKTRPVVTVVPRTGDDSDVMGALMGERVLDWAWEFLNLTRIRRAALMWSRVASAGFIKSCWDSAKGDFVEVFTLPDPNADGAPKMLLDQYGRPMRSDRQDVGGLLEQAGIGADTLGTQRVAQGDVVAHARSPFEVFPDDLADDTGLESAMWLIEEVIQSTGYVAERYDRELEADSQASAGIMESRMPGMYGTEEPPKSGVVVREFWARPGSDFPKGKHVVWAGGDVLREDDNPYKWLPYTMFRGTPAPGRFWPTCFTEQAISPQTELNKTLSQLAENGYRVGNPPLAESRQANVEWSGLPGERIKYDDTLQNAVPSFVNVPEVPGYVQNRVPQLIEAIGEQAGQHEVSHGNVPTGVTAAAAINLLQEADDTRLGPDIEDMEVALGELGSKLLELYGRYYSDNRVLQIAGEDGAWDIFDFKGSMLRGNTNAQVQAGSAMPRSKAAKQAAMQEVLGLALQYGVELDQRSLRKFFTDYEAGGLERLFGDIDQDERQVQRENRRLGMGEQFDPNSFDNHAFHIDGHNEFRKSARFELLSGEAKAAFEYHVRAHEQAMGPPVPVGPDGQPLPAAPVSTNGAGPVPPTIPVQ